MEKDHTTETAENEKSVSRNFIETEIDKDLAEGKYTEIVTRFPPEPNGYLHIGHAKSILLNYGIAKKYGGRFNLRFDDTNPTKEKTEFVNSIVEDVRWLGAEFDGEIRFASNYFDQMYENAVKLIRKGLAYVDDLSAEQIREYRGTLTEPGKNSPYRDRSIEENLQLFEDMKNGRFEDGAKVLRAKIDMASPNINMRDPVIYRIARMTHHNTGDKWCIYPMYDFAHPIEDAIEGVTHSLCTLEFEDHRPLYNWVVQNLDYPHPPRQIEFAKLYLTNVVTGKRYIKKLVENGTVDGWDDPRLVTIAALRRRGYNLINSCLHQGNVVFHVLHRGICRCIIGSVHRHDRPLYPAFLRFRNNQLHSCHIQPEYLAVVAIKRVYRILIHCYGQFFMPYRFREQEGDLIFPIPQRDSAFGETVVYRF